VGGNHILQVMLHLIHKNGGCKEAGAMKLSFYSDSVQPDMILFFGRCANVDDLMMIFKNSVSDFQEQIEHETVNILRKSEV